MEPRKFEHGYNMLTEQNGLHKEMMMDIGVYNFSAGERVDFEDAKSESAFLLMDGKITLEWQGNKEGAEQPLQGETLHSQAAPVNRAVAMRHSLFDEKPTVLHVPAGAKVTVTAETAAEGLVQKTVNDNRFDAVFYPASSIKNVFLGADNMQGCAKRILRDVFNYSNAPYSNMVLGEDIHLPGRWSSYPPHHHPQPEVYYYRFDKPEGFGVSIIGDEPMLIKDNFVSAIPGGLVHPQVTAPGYAMYYVWMIRHLDGNPWTDRVDDPAYTWLHDPKAKIWEGPPED